MDTTIGFPTDAGTLLLLGLASGVFSCLAYLPYIRDTIKGQTQPQRASWLIWSVLGSISLVSQIYEGATSSLWFAGVQVTGTIIVFGLSVRSGLGKYLHTTDYTILVFVAFGLLLWLFTENAVYALAISIGISLLGGTVTVLKAYRNPESETLSTWVISLIASICAALSVGRMDWILLAYPLYLFTLYTAFVIAIVTGRAREHGVLVELKP